METPALIPRPERTLTLDARSHIAFLELGPELTPQSAPEMLPADAEAGDQDANLLALSDGRLMQHGFLWYPLTPEYGERMRTWHPYVQGNREQTGVCYAAWGSYARFRQPSTGAWSARQPLAEIAGIPDIVPGKRRLAGGAARGRAVELDDGSLLIATYFSHPRAGHRNASYLCRSGDGGASWRYAGPIALDGDGLAGYCEPALLHFGAGRLLAFHRSMALDDRLVTARSDDGGASWQAPRIHDLKGHPFDALLLSDGRVFLVYGYRHPPCGVRARLIDPQADDFSRFPEFTIRDDGPTRDLGYPWAVQFEDGRIAVVYYFTDRHGLRHIAASVLHLTDA